MLTVETYFKSFLKSLSRNAWMHRIPGKWKYQVIVYIPLLPVEANDVLITYIIHL